jgi:hypothetical protein
VPGIDAHVATLLKAALSPAGKVVLQDRPVHDLKNISITKTDDELQIVWGEVYAPGYPDSQGDFATEDTVRQMAYTFMKNQAMTNIDLNHSREDCGAYIVESFVARDGDPIFLKGSWVIGVHIPDAEQWSMVKSGDLNGFSLDGMGLRIPTNLEIELPEYLKGETDGEDHKHMFQVQFSETGQFLGGETDVVDGHSHKIIKGTVTEDGGDPPHNHRFSWVDGILKVIDHEGTA